MRANAFDRRSFARGDQFVGCGMNIGFGDASAMEVPPTPAPYSVEYVLWHKARYGVDLTLPVSEAVVIQFLVDHIQRKSKTGLVSELPPALDQALVAAGLKAKVGPLKLSTVVQRVAVLSSAHKLKRLANPCELPSVRTLLNRARRAAVKRGERPAKETAITRAELEAMLATCDDSLEGVRDRALLCFGFASGGRRRSEIAAADMRDLRKVGDDGYIYRLEYSKTQQAGVTVASTPDKPILGRSAEALAAWLQVAGLDQGAIFRRIWKGRAGPALLPGSVAAIVKRRAKLAGLEGDFGAHSLRSGFVAEAGKQGVPLPAVMAMTEHRSVASVVGYFQAGAAEDNPAARLLK